MRPGQQVHQASGLLRRSRRADPARRCGSMQPPRPSSGNFIPASSVSDREQVEFYTKLQDPTGKFTYQITKNNKLRSWAGRPQVAAVSHRQVHPARVDAEPGLVVADRAVDEVAVGADAEVDVRASLQRGGYWWPDVPWSTASARPTWRPEPDARRVPRDRSHAAALAMAHLRTSRKSAAAITS